MRVTEGREREMGGRGGEIAGVIGGEQEGHPCRVAEHRTLHILGNVPVSITLVCVGLM